MKETIVDELKFNNIVNYDVHSQVLPLLALCELAATLNNNNYLHVYIHALIATCSCL